MRRKIIFLSLLPIAFVTATIACKGKAAPARTAETGNAQVTADAGTPANSNILKDRFLPPAGYQRVKTQENSFASYLQNLPLKPEGSDLHYYNGSVKEQAYRGAVVDVDFGHAGAEQCADAIIYLRAAWLWQTKQYDKIHFNFTNGFRADYIWWAKGERIHINQRTWQCSWSKDAAADYSYKAFRRYLSLVFLYAGTASLEKELAAIRVSELTIGDVIINGGYPGHTVLIVDEARDADGNKAFLLAQGFTPAQEIEVFRQWIAIDAGAAELVTPGWIFRGKYSKRFK